MRRYVGRKWVFRDGQPIEVDPYYRPKPRAFYIHTDSMEPVHHPLTGQMMDSKSAFRQVTTDHGYVECGNDREQKPDYFETKEYDNKLTEDCERAFQQESLT